MKARLHNRFAVRLGLMALLVSLTAALVHAQAASRFLGTITAINGTTITVKTSQGEEHQVQVPSTADLKRIEPGQTNLSAAQAMQFSALATGDHVLVWIDPNSPAGSSQALRIVAIKQADLAKKQAQEREDWQKNGVGGLVKSADPATGTIIVNSGAGPTAKVIIIHTDKNTVLKRYAHASVNYSAAQPAPFDAIHAGDQIMARGTKNPDGSQVTAEEVVSGSFRNISGIISSVDASNNTFEVKDLATKKPVTVEVPTDAQMRELPQRMADFLAARLKGNAAQGNGGAAGQNGGGSAGRGEGRGGAVGNGAGGPGGMDPQQILNRAPAIHFADLKKGDAVMLVATQGESEVTAITLISGVEPLLEAPASQDLLANWSMSSSAPDTGAGDQ